MKTDNDGRLELRDAARETRAELTVLIAKAPAKIASMLTYIREHLFDPNLSVAGAKDACGLRDNSIAIHFHMVLGEPPAAFITARRMEVADRLLAQQVIGWHRFEPSRTASSRSRSPTIWQPPMRARAHLPTPWRGRRERGPAVRSRPIRDLRGSTFRNGVCPSAP